MTRLLCMTALFLSASACADDPDAALGFMEVCTSTPRTDCAGAAADACPADDDCAEGMACLPVGAARLCTASCSGADNTPCTPLASSGLCDTGVCKLYCTTNTDCDDYGLRCNGTSNRCEAATATF